MRRHALKKSIPLLLSAALLAFTSPSEAFTIDQGADCQSGNFSGPYMSLFTFPDRLAHYDPASDLLSIPGMADSHLRYTPNFGSGDSLTFSGSFDLYMHANEAYQSNGGIFTVFGEIPALGIQHPSLLLAANVVAANFDCNPGDGFFSPSIQLMMHVDYSHPDFGAWGENILLAGFLAGDTPDDYLSEAWTAGPPDYWDVLSVPGPVAVSEPTMLSLLVVTLAMLALARMISAIAEVLNESQARDQAADG